MIIHGDCKHVLKNLPAESFDALVTDPPYGFNKQPDLAEVFGHWIKGDDYEATGSGFMGKTWDSFVPGPATWREVFRVLKPGAYGAVFAGSRTAYLMAASLRLAGFEVVDQLFWLYGSGFPKSLDVSQEVDKLDAKQLKKESAYRCTDWIREFCPLSSGQIDKFLGRNGMGRHYRDKAPGGKQPEIPTRADLEKLRPFFTAAVPQWFEDLVDVRTFESENHNSREVIERYKKVAGLNEWRQKYGEQTSAGNLGSRTAPHSDEAKAWHGYGTALKPGYEPIILVRKPTTLTYAENVVTHGTGALNIDGSRNGERFPANILHDGEAFAGKEWERYFYCAKASTADRDDGLQLFEKVSAGDATGGRKEGSAGLNSPRAGAGRRDGARNTHPTVKPTELMKWLCGLLARPGASILDPFTGSGSTWRGAKLNNQKFVGVELSAEYIQIAKARAGAIKP
tara:strand:- start:35072 stop:36430 length:1359 start_codon:yes stop_codon:yes gene_type:complete